MKRLFVLLVACFACMVLQAQQLHWTPVDEGLYSGSTTVIAVVQVNGVEQTSTQMELAVFSGTECRGTAFTTEFPITHRFQAMVNVYGEVGHELTFKAYDHAINEELVMDPVVTVSFTEDGSGTLFSPLELNFRQQLQSYVINVTASPTTGGTVSGGGTYDEGTNCTLTATPATGYVFTNWTKNGTVVSTNANYAFTVTSAGTYVANFTLKSYAITASANPSAGGAVTGGGTYNHGASCTLTATANTGYTFVNWTESGSVVSTSANYAFTVTGTRTLVANFEIENITFADADVKTLCVANWDTNEDGELSYAEAAAVTNLGTVFKNNSTIITFDELQYFTGLTSIGENAFSQCGNLTSIILSNSLTSIGDYAFARCNGLTSIVIPSSVTSIGTGAFNYCSGMEQMVVDDGNAVYDSRDNCNAVIVTATNTLMFGGKNSTIPTTVTAIGRGAFCGRSGITSIVIPENILTIGGSSFESCGNLLSVVIGNSVTTIGMAAFSNCTNLANIVIGESVSLIDLWAFHSCESIESMTVFADTPPSVSTSGYATFSFANDDFPVYVPCGTKLAYKNADGWSRFNIQESESCPIVFADANVKSLCVANWDTNEDGELSYAEAAAVTDLGEVFKENYSIYHFDELQYFTGLTSIGYQAFAWCHNLSSIQMPNTITSIGVSAFYDCRNLQAITIPASVTSIGSSALVCDNLEEIIVEAGNIVYDSRDNCNAVVETSTNTLIRGCNNTVIPNTVVSLGSGAFSSCTMESVFIPASITGIYDGTFYACEYLAEITVAEDNPVYDSRDNCNAIIKTATNELVAGSRTTVIPNTVTSIGSKAFSYRFRCGSYDIIIPGSVTSIGYNAYIGGYAVNSLTVLAEAPPTLGGDAFEYVPKDIPVYVPCGTVAEYQVASGWSEFNNYQELECPSFEITATANPMVGGTITGAGSYTQGTSCTLTATSNAGYTFVNWTENGTQVSISPIYTFEVTGARDLVANFVATGPITPHWTPVTGMLNNMTIEGVVLIDGVEQTSPTLELGAFCGDECRGTVLPFEDGGQWWYFILISGEGGDMITFRLFDHTTMQELESQFVGTIEFVADDDIDPYEFNFANNVTITAIVNPAEAGIVSGAGEYLIGSSATLTVAANEGYAFRNWTVDDNVVSTESTYTFTVTTAITVNANFDRVQNEVLPAGWNWWSTYIEQEDINGLTMLENGLGEAGIMVKAQNSYVKRRANGSWMGSLASITNEDGYKINVSANCSANVTGTPVVASDHPITIKPNWTWIGYPVNVQQTVVVALLGYQPVVGDMIKGASGFAKYRSNGWMPSSFMLEPGKSYMYNSKATENKTLVYSTSRAGTPDETPVEKYWDNDIHTYPDNITMIAVVNLNGEELRDDNAELGAFVGFECRGSARLFHDVETDRYLAMITITGEDGDLIDFGIVNNKRTVMGSATPITFHADDMLGDFDAPKEIVFGTMAATGFKVYPNPVVCGQPVVLNLPEDETVAELKVTNTLGVTVLHHMANGREMLGLPTPGVYMIQVVCKSGNKYHERIIVK